MFFKYHIMNALVKSYGFLFVTVEHGVFHRHSLSNMFVTLCLQEEGHTDWVSCVRFSPNTSNPIIVSSSWDKKVKVR